MRLMGGGYELYCPDTHILLAELLYSDIPTNDCTFRVKKLRNVYGVLTKNFDIIVFKAHQKDFNNFLLNTLRPFFETITRHAISTKDKNIFKKKVEGALKYNGSLSEYWEIKQRYFLNLPLGDKTTIQDILNGKIMDYYEKYGQIISGHLFEDSKDDESLYKVLKYYREKKEIASAQDRDLMILAACLDYTLYYLAEGMLYLTSGDRNLCSACETILKTEFDINGEKRKISGFNILHIDTFLQLAYKNRLTKNSKNL